MSTEPPQTVPPFRKRTLPNLAWVNTTYFAEGLPYTMVRNISSLYFTELGMREVYLGLLNGLGLPWNLKFLWAPVLDSWGSKKGWQVATQILLGILTAVVALLSYLAGLSSDPSAYFTWIAGAFLVMAFVAATNDVAIDAYYLEALPSRDQQALFSGYRVLAYRLAMVFARSGLVWGAGYATAKLASGSPALGWVPAFLAAAFVLFILGVFHLIALPLSPIKEPQLSGDGSPKPRSVFVDGFRSYLAQPRILLILGFVVLYKLGDEVLFSMATPFLKRELGITTEQFAWVAGIVGAVGTIVGALVGGWWIKKVGLRRALWPLTLLMNVNILLYVWLAAAKPDPHELLGITAIATVHGIEQIAAGLGSAALLVFLLSTCSPAYRATHYAIGSAIMSLPATLFGGAAGQLVEMLGYTNLYTLAFLLSIPGMCFIPYVPIRDEGT